jgi:two-component system, sensor histidine kinase ChiS
MTMLQSNTIARSLICALFLVTTSSVSFAQTKCASLERGRTPVTASTCLRLLPDDAASATGAATAERYFEIAQSRMGEDRFDDASLALDCAESAIGGSTAVDFDQSGSNRSVSVRSTSIGGQPIEGVQAIERYQLVRRRGLLAYRRQEIPSALSKFECAAEMARARGDRVAAARDLNNVGSALRRLGDFRGALAALNASLDVHRESGESTGESADDFGKVLNNIGDVYRELEAPDQAIRYYAQAVEQFAKAGNRAEVAHAKETMSVLALDRGDTGTADLLLNEAMREYREIGQRPYQLHVYAGLAQSAIAVGDLSRARQQLAGGFALAEQYDLQTPANLELQAARLDRLSGREQAAITRLRKVLSRLPDSDVNRPALLDEVARSLESAGDATAATAALRQASDAERLLAKARHDRQLEWTRARFEASEREHKIAELESENRVKTASLRQKTLTMWLILASAVSLLLLLSMLYLRRLQRARLSQVAMQARHAEELARYRREVDALSQDRSLLQNLLDSRGDAVCLLGGEGDVLAVSRDAADLLGIERDGLIGQIFTERIQVSDADAFNIALERMEDASEHFVQFHPQGDSAGIQAELKRWEDGDGMILVRLRRQEPQAETAGVVGEAAHDAMQENNRSAEELPAAARDAFRRALVELMLCAVDAWESSTGLKRIELAERSKVWRITVDDGRLRARAMNRYLSLAKLPENPRWRDVLRSAYYVLSHCELEQAKREELQARIDGILGLTRRSALA